MFRLYQEVLNDDKIINFAAYVMKIQICKNRLFANA